MPIIWAQHFVQYYFGFSKTDLCVCRGGGGSGEGVWRFLCTCVCVCGSRFNRGVYLIDLHPVSLRFLTSLSDNDAVML